MSASSSSSSEAWSDTEEQSSKPDIQQTNGEASNRASSYTRPRHGEKLSFQPPPGYLPSPFSKETLSIFGKNSVKASPNKQLWVIKIPEEVSPDTLDGLVIDVPSSSSSTLAQLKIQMPIRGSAIRSQIKSYTLRSQSSGRRPKERGEPSTQLIAMAGGHDSTNTDFSESRMQEGESLQVMLPHSESQSGRYVFAPTPTKYLLQLVLDESKLDSITATELTQQHIASNALQPATIAGATTSVLKGEKRKREQPVGKLNGSFVPAGARSGTQRDLNGASQSPSKAKKAKKEQKIRK